MIYASDADHLTGLTVTLINNKRKSTNCNQLQLWGSAQGMRRVKHKGSVEKHTKIPKKTPELVCWIVSDGEAGSWSKRKLKGRSILIIALNLEVLSGGDAAWDCPSKEHMLFIILLFLVFLSFQLHYIWHLKADCWTKSLGRLPQSIFPVKRVFT